MSFDERELGVLITESQDLQSEAIAGVRSSLPELEQLRHERGDVRPGPAERRAFDLGRRSLLARLGLAGGGAAVAGAGIGGAMAALLSTPASADSALDVQILQTASSLEKLAVETYKAALTLPFISGGNKTVVAFAQMTMKQHDEHKMAFQAQTTKLGGKVQDAPNPKYAPVVEAAKPTLKAPLDVVKLAMTLENVARDTYLSDLAQFTDAKSRSIMASIMGVETQHLATLRAVAALLAGGAPQLIAIPTSVKDLPAAAGSVGFPDAIPTPKMASPAKEGAL
ncbi:MAG: ferritin-like domain-containing protein [Acidimicrobiales bacterium]